MLPLRYPLGNLAARRLRTGLTIGVIALVVLATTLFAGLVSSLERTLATTGSERNLVVMRKGATNDGSSAVTLDAYVCNYIGNNAAAAHALIERLVAAFAPQQVQRQQLQRGAVGAPASAAQ